MQYARELPKLVTGYSRYKVGPGMIHLAQQWMRFVRDRCERGRGLRPRWANQGLNFLIAACEPQYLKDLNEEAFKVCALIGILITHLFLKLLRGMLQASEWEY